MYGYVCFMDEKQIEIDCDYISLRSAMQMLTKYKLYVFKYKKNKNILYLEYPFDSYYSSKKINLVDTETEDDIKSFTYVEVRLLDRHPSSRIGVNMTDL